MTNSKSIITLSLVILTTIVLMGNQTPGCTLPPPQITEINPTSAEIGESINIVGSHFGNVQGSSKVWFYPFVEAIQVNGWDDSLINVVVPEGVKDGYVHLFVEGRYSNPINLEILPRVSVLPDTGQEKCYDMDGNEIECGSAYVGQDAEYDTGCQQSYVDNGDGTVFDNCTGLMWQQEDDDVPRNWGEALGYCEGLEIAGYDDWRLPNKRELESIVDNSKVDPSINDDYFLNTNTNLSYWSSTTYDGINDNSWKVGFYSGFVKYDEKISNLYVRCVR